MLLNRQIQVIKFGVRCDTEKVKQKVKNNASLISVSSDNKKVPNKYTSIPYVPVNR